MKKNMFFKALIWLLQGTIVGIGAIVPGLSGGALLYAFGLYAIVIEALNSPIKGIKKSWLPLLCIIIGGGIGFVGFSGVIDLLIKWNEPVVTAVFVGFILGTIPGLWREAGERGRGKWSYVALGVCFTALFTFFLLIKTLAEVRIENPAWPHFALCGLLWGLSFIIPGLSSSSLLLFLGLQGPMSEGISHLYPEVIFPLGITMVICVLLLARVMKIAFDKAYPILSHSILGFVVATTVVIIPPFNTGFINTLIYILCIINGAVASFFFSMLCSKIKKKGGI